MHAITLLLLTVLAGTDPTTPPDAVAAAAAVPPQTGPITRHRIDAAKTAYIEQVGPYWSLHQPFAQVRKYMAKHELPGTLFVRYIDDPLRTPSDSLRTEVGFFIDGDFEVEPPFQSRQCPATTAASLVVDAAQANVAGAARTIGAWIRDHGYEAAGPLMEILPGTDREEVPRPQVTFQVAIRPVTHVRTETPPTPGVAPISTEAPTLDEDSEPDGESGSAGAAHAHTERPSPAPPHRHSDGERAERIAPPELVGCPPSVTGMFEGPREPAQGRTAAIPFADIADMMADHLYDEIARQLIPDPWSTSDDLQRWLGQLVLRVRVAGRGISKLYPGDGAAPSALAEAVARRFAASSGYRGIPPSVTAPHTNAGHPRSKAGQRAVLRALDQLLARLAVRDMDAAEARRALARIIADAREVVLASTRRPNEQALRHTMDKGKPQQPEPAEQR